MKKRKLPMIKEYEDIYHDWIEEVYSLGFTVDTPTTKIMLEMQKALRRVMQGTNLKQQGLLKEER